MIDNSAAWIKRATEILRNQPPASEAVPSAISMLTALYGPQSTQLQGFMTDLQMIRKTAENTSIADRYALRHALGAIENAKAELEAGLIVRVRVLVAGEMLAELLRLGREALEERTEETKNVAAVLIAAAFEDLMRRMGEEFASVGGRPPLQDVIIALKKAGVLTGGQPGTAQSYLKFRNDSLHADWNQVDRSQVVSCLGFTEELLTKHFS